MWPASDTESGYADLCGTGAHIVSEQLESGILPPLQVYIYIYIYILDTAGAQPNPQRSSRFGIRDLNTPKEAHSVPLLQAESDHVLHSDLKN